MPPTQKRHELEAYVCELERKIQESVVFLDQKEIALKWAQVDLEEKQQRAALHETNMKFMRKQASLVDIKEFTGVQKLLVEARHALEDAQVKASTLFTAVRHFKAVIAEARGEIHRTKGVLEGFGRVVQWSVK